MQLRICLAWLVIAATAVVATAGARWWDFAWPYRHGVNIGPVRPTRLSGSDIAVVTLYTAGLARPDGGDLRVTTASGKVTPCRVLMTGPGDRVRLAFAVVGAARRYHVYFGHPDPPASAPLALKIRRGVLLEMWEYPGGAFRTFEQVRSVISSAKVLFGRKFVGRIFLGHNPFGPHNRIASVFTAYLVCPQDGEYTFATSSRNASFLLVDAKPVVDNGGSHVAQRDARMQGTIHLTRGLHELKFYHVSPSGWPIAVVAWKPPGAGKIAPIASRDFAPVAQGRVEPLEQYGKTLTVDFAPVHAGETFAGNRYYQRYTFGALVSGKAGRSVEWHWDFGDGQTSDQAEIDHVYLLPGPYTVTLTARTFVGTLTRSNRIVVSRPWARITSNRLDKLGLHGDIVEKYDFGSLGDQANAEAISLLKYANKTDAMLAAGDAFIRRDKASDKSIMAAMPIYTDRLIFRRLARRAAAAAMKAAKMTENAVVRAKMSVRAGRTYLDELADIKRARDAFAQAVKVCEDAENLPALLRAAKIGVGDVWRAEGNYHKAAEAYAAAPPAKKANDRAAVARGDFVRHVEAYLRQKLYGAAEDYLGRWEERFPLDKLEGHSTLLRIQLLMAQGHIARCARAVREAEILVAVNPASSYAPQVLMLAATAYEKLSKPGQAAATYRRIAVEYPESQLAGAAAQKAGDN